MYRVKLYCSILTAAFLLGGLPLCAQQKLSDTIQLRETTVSAMRERADLQRLQEVDGDKIYSGKKNEVLLLQHANANLVTNNARQIFMKVPGVMVWESDGSGVQIGIAARGLSPNRSWEFNVRQNGYDVTPDVFGYPESYYNPPMEAVDRIELVRGAASLQYGPQFGGLLNYRIKQAPADRKFSFETSNTVGSYGMFSTFNGIGGTAGKFDYYAFINYRLGDGWRKNSAYRIGNGFVHLGYRFSPKWRVTAEGTFLQYKNQQPGGLTDAEFAAGPSSSSRSRNWFSTPWFVGNVALEYTPSARFQASLRVNRVDAERNSVGFVRAITIPDTFNVALGGFNPRQVDRDFYENLGAELRTRTSYKLLGQQHALVAGSRIYGCQTRRSQLGRGTAGNDFDLALDGERFPRDLQFETRNLAFFVENLFRITSRWSVTPGLRVENLWNKASGRINISSGNEQTITPQQRTRLFTLAGIGSEYKVGKSSNFYANWTQAYRPVLYSDLTPSATTDIIDDQLEDAQGYNLDLGFRGRVDGWLNFDLSVFELAYNNRIGTLVRLDAGNQPFNFRTNVGASRTRGVEAYVEADVLRLLAGEQGRHGSLSIFGSLSRMKARYLDFPVIIYSTQTQTLTETNLAGKRVEYAPDYVYRAGITYAKRSFSIAYQHHFTGSVFADAGNTEKPTANAQAGLIPAYDVADLNVQWAFLKHYRVRAGLNNLYDSAYFTRRSGGYPGPGVLPGDGRTWYVSVGAKF